MKIRISRLFLRLIFLTASLLFVSGCAQQMKSVQSEPLVEPSGNAVIKSIQFSEDASIIEINTDKPIVYTYYMLDDPPRIIVDLAQTTSGALILPIDVNKGNIKRLDVARHEFGSGVLSRIDITLTDKVDVTAVLDKQNNKKLLLTVKGVKAEADAPRETAEKAVAVAPAAVADAAVTPEIALAAAPAPSNMEPVAEEKPVAPSNPPAEPVIAPVPVVEAPLEAAPVVADTPEPEPQAKAEPPAKPKALPPGSPRSLTAITTGEEIIEIEISSPVESFRTFKLSRPDRIVVDIANTKNLITAKVVEVNKFNLGKARIGGTTEKLRVVFDADGRAIPAYHVLKSGNGLQIAFGEAASKAVVARTEPPVEKVTTPAPDAVPAEVTAAAPEATATPPAIAVAAPEATAMPPAVAAAAPETTATPPVSAPTQEPSPAAAPAAAPQVAAAPVSTPPAAEIKPVAKPLPATVENDGAVDAIEFSQADGFSLITVRTSGACSASQPLKNAKGVQLTLKIKNCRLPVNLQRTLDTSGFESVIKEIAPYPVKIKKGYETRLAVKMKAPAPYLFKQEGTAWILEIREPVVPVKISRPVKTQKQVALLSGDMTSDSAGSSMSAGMEREFADPKSEPGRSRTERAMEEDLTLNKISSTALKPAKVYTGRKVSLEFSDADIRKIFQLIAEVSNQNFLISDDVSGTISLKLVNVPWDQALDVILENKGLGMQKDGNIVQIRPKAKMKSLDDEAVELLISEEKKLPLSTVVFDINFATLTDIENQFKNLKSKRADSSIAIDARTNKIIVVDIEPNIKKMRKLLESLDIPEKQVMIEARIVEASTNFARDIGVKWSFGYQDGGASVFNINNVTGSMGGIVSGSLPSLTTGGFATGVSFGKLLSNIQLDMRLSAAATIGQVKIISTPRVLTVNNKAAKISQGQMVPYQNTSSAEGARTEFIEAALSLEVTPHITADGSVNMKIKASNNSVGTGSPPPINKKEATTELVVKNGETTVIGGIYVDSETEGDTGIPYLMDIPLLGWLFKSNAKVKAKNELLIFITPKIIN